MVEAAVWSIKTVAGPFSPPLECSGEIELSRFWEGWKERSAHPSRECALMPKGQKSLPKVTSWPFAMCLDKDLAAANSSPIQDGSIMMVKRIRN